MTKLGKEYLASISKAPQTAQDCHVLNVYADHEFINELKAAKSTDEFALLAKRYAITTDDITYFLNGHKYTRLLKKTNQKYDLQPDFKGNWVARISNDITKSEFDEMWDEISRVKERKYKGEVPQPKPPKYKKLLYAIFKQRQNSPPTPFSEIHKMYLEDRLPYYTHEKNDKYMLDAKKFEEYFRKHKPNPRNPRLNK